jgi:hypothetical protein
MFCFSSSKGSVCVLVILVDGIWISPHCLVSPDIDNCVLNKMGNLLLLLAQFCGRAQVPKFNTVYNIHGYIPYLAVIIWFWFVALRPYMVWRYIWPSCCVDSIFTLGHAYINSIDFSCSMFWKFRRFIMHTQYQKVEHARIAAMPCQR